MFCLSNAWCPSLEVLDVADFGYGQYVVQFVLLPRMTESLVLLVIQIASKTTSIFRNFPPVIVISNGSYEHHVRIMSGPKSSVQLPHKKTDVLIPKNVMFYLTYLVDDNDYSSGDGDTGIHKWIDSARAFISTRQALPMTDGWLESQRTHLNMKWYRQIGHYFLFLAPLLRRRYSDLGAWAAWSVEF